MKMNDYHVPVLLQECIDALQIKSGGVYVDVTFGAGGHSREMLSNIGAEGHLYAFDQDVDAIDNALQSDSFTLIHSNYRHIDKFMDYYNVDGVDGVLADLGISSHQIDIPERGFSFRYDAPLDMRMNVKQQLTAADVLNDYSESDLVRVFSDYGEVRNSKTLAREVIAIRSKSKIETTFSFNEVLRKLRFGPESKYMAQVYQALRIEVNDEVKALEEFLLKTVDLLKPGGRFVVISYHSLEDRLVKHVFKAGNAKGELLKDDFGNIYRPFQLINKKPILPSKEELKNNTRSRSAKLRIAEKK